MSDGPTILVVLVMAALAAFGVTSAVNHTNTTKEIKRGWFEHNGLLYRITPAEPRP